METADLEYRKEERKENLTLVSPALPIDSEVHGLDFSPKRITQVVMFSELKTSVFKK